MNGYIDIEDVNRYAWEYTEKDTALFEPLIIRASRIFDIMCYVPAGYFLEKSATPEARTFYGSNSIYLMLPVHYEPVVSVTMPSSYTVPKYVEVDDCLRTADDNGVLFEPLASNRSYWPNGVPITVTAKWGFAAVPEDVKEAVVELVIAMWRSKDQAFLKAVNLDSNAVIVKDTPERTKLVAAFYNSRKKMPAFV